MSEIVRLQMLGGWYETVDLADPVNQRVYRREIARYRRRQRVQTLYRQGFNASQIAKKVGYHYTTVKDDLDETGIIYEDWRIQGVPVPTARVAQWYRVYGADTEREVEVLAEMLQNTYGLSDTMVHNLLQGRPPFQEIFLRDTLMNELDDAIRTVVLTPEAAVAFVAEPGSRVEEILTSLPY